MSKETVRSTSPLGVAWLERAMENSGAPEGCSADELLTHLDWLWKDRERKQNEGDECRRLLRKYGVETRWVKEAHSDDRKLLVVGELERPALDALRKVRVRGATTGELIEAIDEAGRLQGGHAK